MESSETNWWIWAAIYHGRGSPIFLYGSAVPVSSELKTFPMETVKISENEYIKIHQEIIISSTFYSFTDALDSNQIELKIVFQDINEEFKIVTKRMVLQASYGHGRNNVESYFTLPKIDKILRQNLYQSLPLILTTLKETLGFSFDNQYATRLGCFEIHHLNPWLEDNPPFSINLIKPNIDIKNISKPSIEIKRKVQFSESLHYAHIICRHEDEEIFNQLIKLDKGQRKSSLITTPDDFGELEAWLFDDEGKIIHHELNYYLLGINLGMGIQGRTVNIADKLSKKEQTLGQKNLSVVTRVTTQHSQVNYGDSNGTIAHYALMKRLVAECYPKQEKDRWFKKSIEDEIGVIHHFKKIIDNGFTNKAIIVDPFFSEESLIRLVTRFSQTNLDVCIVTSWAKIDPDTGIEFAEDKAPIEDLKSALEKTKHVINPNLKIINLQWKGEQAFHDRYLVLYPITGKPEAYLLSNSLNKMAGNWPFCMSLISPSVAYEVILYVAALTEGKDISREGDPDITFEWSSRVSK